MLGVVSHTLINVDPFTGQVNAGSAVPLPCVAADLGQHLGGARLKSTNTSGSRRNASTTNAGTQAPCVLSRVLVALLSAS